MKKENILVIALVCIALVSVMVYQRFPTNQSLSTGQDYLIEWKSYDSGLQLAKEQSKPVFLYFYADWCSFCKELKKTTFLEKEVLDFLAANYVSIKVDTDVDRALAVQWKVNGLPTSWFLTPDGTQVQAIPGYMDKTKFLNILKRVQSASMNQS